MASAILAIIFVVLLFLFCSLQRVLYHQSARELKRRARRGDLGASQLYKLAAHGENLHLLLWILIIVSAALSCITLAKLLSFWPALILILLVLWLSFVWLPNSRVSQLELEVASWLASPLAWLAELLHGPIAALVKLVSRLRPAIFHTGVYEIDDLLDLLEAQKHQPDNRIDRESLDLAIGGLTFGRQIIEDHMMPRRSVKTVTAGDSVTPKLVDELHKSGQQQFPVVEGRPERIVGTLRLDDLIDLQKSGMVKNLMDTKVFYVHEDGSLAEVLDAFYKTRHHLFVVVNKFEDFVGVITIEDVIEQIIGRPILSDFDDYASAEAVATHIARRAAGSEPEQEEEIVAEVVE